MLSVCAIPTYRVYQLHDIVHVLDATPYSTIPDGSLIPCMSILVKGDRALLHKCALPNLCLTNRPSPVGCM